MGMAMEFRAKREPDRGGDSVRFSIVGLKGEKAVPVHNLSTWVRLCCLAHGEMARLFHEPHTGLDNCLRMLQACVRTRMSE